jgi:hypothetical protein
LRKLPPKRGITQYHQIRWNVKARQLMIRWRRQDYGCLCFSVINREKSIRWKWNRSKADKAFWLMMGMDSTWFLVNGKLGFVPFI